MSHSRVAPWTVYLGTTTADTPEAAKGIYRFTVSPETGAISPLELVAKTVNPTFLALHPSGKTLYAVNETQRFLDQPGGGVSAFARDPLTGALTLLNQQPVGSSGPCHVAVDHTGRVLVTANYGGGSISVFPILANGSLGPRSDFHQDAGSGVNKRRQEGPHAHGITFSPDNRYVLVPDLGIDQILVYRLDIETSRLIANDPPAFSTAPGAGPRHFAFSPDARFGYAINELDNTVTTLRWDAARGLLSDPNSVSTLPADFAAPNTAAEVVVHPSGDFVYASNRGHDSLALFHRHRETGRLTPLGHIATGGASRSFALSPDGLWLLAANQNTQTLQLFRIDAQKGTLTPHGTAFPASAPTCVLFTAASAKEIGNNQP